MSAKFSGDFSNWRETRLWKKIEADNHPDTKVAHVLIESMLTDVQKLLTHGALSTMSYTLHDAQHSFRVAEWMADLLSKDVFDALSLYESVLLLLSAYLHDIGMFPKISLADDYLQFVLTGETVGLDNNKVNSIQNWMDQQQDIKTSDNSASPVVRNRKEASLVIFKFIRDMHAEWGRDFIQESYLSLNFGSYNQWLSDLKILCTSHVRDYKELIGQKFDPKPVGNVTPNTTSYVHLRFLACVLRIADILDVDPERTPEVLFTHKDIAPESVIFWKKDHQITVVIDKERVLVSADPTDSKIHKAVFDFASELERELELINRLHIEKPFNFFGTIALPHQWSLPSRVQRRVSPRDNKYEYIDGSFRPNTEKLLQLLSGQALYESPLAAVRELVQNGLDAINEVIAYERLQKSSPGDSQWNETLGKTHRLLLRTETDEEGRVWLVCVDDGAGMSLDIITKFLLISGMSKRPDHLKLERLCEKAGFKTYRMGQFGIGVLSYFMIADKVQFRTRRNSITGSSEANGWLFETEGVGSFGELRKETEWITGTQMRLRIASSFIEKLASEEKEQQNDYGFDKESYLEENPYNSFFPGASSEAVFVRNVAKLVFENFYKPPCDILLESGENTYKFPRGWKDLGWMDPLGEIDEIAGEIDHYDDFISAHHRTRVFYGPLPEDLGEFKLCISYYEYPEGNSLLGLISEEEKPDLTDTCSSVVKLNEGYPRTYLSWRGCRLPESRGVSEVPYLPVTRPHGIDNFSFHIDILDDRAGTISVSRNAFNPSGLLNNVLARLSDEFMKIAMQLISENPNASFNKVDKLLLHDYSEIGDVTDWLVISLDKNRFRTCWGELKYPITDFRPEDLDYLNIKSFIYQGMPVYEFGYVQDAPRPTSIFIANKIVGVEAKPKEFLPVPLVTKKLPFRTSLFTESPDLIPRNPAYFCEFPPNWKNVLGVSDRGVLYFNPVHLLFKGIDELKIGMAKKRVHGLREKGMEIDLGNAMYAVLDFLELLTMSVSNEFPEMMIDARFQELAQKSKFFGLPENVLELFLLESDGYLYHRDGRRVKVESSEIKTYLPRPPEGWVLSGI